MKADNMIKQKPGINVVYSGYHIKRTYKDIEIVKSTKLSDGRTMNEKQVSREIDTVKEIPFDRVRKSIEIKHWSDDTIPMDKVFDFNSDSIQMAFKSQVRLAEPVKEMLEKYEDKFYKEQNRKTLLKHPAVEKDDIRDQVRSSIYVPNISSNLLVFKEGVVKPWFT